MLSITKPNYAECTRDASIIDPSKVITNKCFHGDILKPDLTVEKTNRASFLIGGLLKLKNTYTFGFNDKGIELFEFKPTNWRFPKFLVSSNIKTNTLKRKEPVVDHFVVIKFKNWDFKIPIGTIELDLGPANDINSQFDVLFYYYPTMPITKVKPLPIEYKDPEKVSIDLQVYSVDPFGCIDIDDALSYDSEKKRIGIHIADVAEIIDEYSFPRFSTVYAPHRNVHMFPENISTEFASLREGKIKNVITCWIYDDRYEFETNQVKITKNLTYDEAEGLKVTNPILKTLYEKSIELGKELKIDVIDTHKMVEVYMILYNKFITEKLEKEVGMIFRNQKGVGKAIYDFKREGHSKLDLTHYTHASSPIRRYADYIIQKIYKKRALPVVDLDKVNQFERDIKSISRMWDYLKASQEIKSGEEYEIEFREIQDDRLIFFCESLKIIISNRIAFELMEDGRGMEINKVKYVIGDKYKLKLYLVEDKKHVMFFKILIQF